MFSSKREDRFIGLREFLSNFKTLFRGSLIGIGVGAMPGLGAPVASFMSYDQAMKRSKHKEEFGKGRLEGIAASEAANSSVVASSLIPLFVLGIPGNLAAAMLMGAFMIHGMQPGPLLFKENAQLMYGIYGSLVLASLFLLVIGRFGLRLFCKAVDIPAMILYPIVIFTCIMGSLFRQVFPVRCRCHAHFRLYRLLHAQVRLFLRSLPDRIYPGAGMGARAAARSSSFPKTTHSCSSNAPWPWGFDGADAVRDRPNLLDQF